MRLPTTLFLTGAAVLLAACQPRVQPQGQDSPAAAAPVAAGGPALARGPAPQIAFDEREFSAGTVKQGDTIQHTFVVRNRGLGELNIEKVKGS